MSASEPQRPPPPPYCFCLSKKQRCGGTVDGDKMAVDVNIGAWMLRGCSASFRYRNHVMYHVTDNNGSGTWIGTSRYQVWEAADIIAKAHQSNFPIAMLYIYIFYVLRVVR